MHALTLYGTPEDGIKIEGDFQEELDAFAVEEGAYLAISDGTLLTIGIDGRGVWRIGDVALGPGTTLEKVDGTLDSGKESDTVTLRNPGSTFQWVLMGSTLAGSLEGSESGAQ
jgi:hypothetical protein